MSKNNYLINSIKKASAKFQRDVEEMFACVAICLKEDTNISDDDILVFLGNFQGKWIESINKNIDVVKECEEKTGIDIRRI